MNPIRPYDSIPRRFTCSGVIAAVSSVVQTPAVRFAAMLFFMDGKTKLSSYRGLFNFDKFLEKKRVCGRSSTVNRRPFFAIWIVALRNSYFVVGVFK
jgi:hypothetical protein